MTEQYKRIPNSKCLLCNEPIYRRPSEREKGHVFCSQSCYGLSCRKERPCVVCGKPILSSLNKKTCSRSCSNVNRIGIHYNNKRINDKATTLRTIKIQLLKLRGEKCERCNYAKGDVLQVHHKDRNRKNNSYKNLELICPNCHYEEHYLKVVQS